MNHYKSFQNGGSFFLSNILIDSLASIFMNDNISKIKIARFLSSKKYQNLRVKLGISIMKTITSFVSYRQSIGAENNKGLLYLYKKLNEPICVTDFITKYIALFQLLIGIKCNEKTINDEFSMKEFYAFEFARELGLFDKDYNINEKQMKMLYSFLYMVLVFVCDRKLLCFDPDIFTEEQIIFALKQKVHSIDKLSKLYDKSPQTINNRLNRFNGILMKVTSKNRKESNNEKNENDNDNQKSNVSSKSLHQEV